MKKLTSAKCVLLAALALAPLALVQGNELSQLDDLLKSGAVDDAYQLASDLYDENVGEPAFDFLFALAAIDSGHPDEAVFALERVVLEYQNDVRARLELARAHFLLADYQQSREQFAKVLTYSPPENVVANINRFLEAIKIAEREQRSSMSYYITNRIGYDTNVNGASDQEIFALADFEILIDEESQETDDYFLEYQVGFNYRHKMNSRAHSFVNGQYTDKIHRSARAFDTGTYSINFGMEFSYARDAFRIPVELANRRLDREEYRKTSSIGVEWTHLGGERTQYKTFAQFGKHSFDDDPLENTAFFLAALTWQHRLENWPIIINGTGIFSEEKAVNTEGRHNGKYLAGALANVQWFPLAKHMFFVGGDRLSTFYRDFNSSLDGKRVDINFGGNGGWVWQVAPQFTFDLRGLYQKTNSNISIYTTERWTISAGLRYDFK